jgi:peptidoglycan hydrolase CwlO-like protein
MEDKGMTKTVRRAVRAMVVIGLLTGTSGCDWWPPTLQERIGQQEVQIKALGGENVRLQSQVAELTRAVEETKAQIAQLQEANTALKTQVEQLKLTLADAEAKLRSKTPIPARRKK